MVGHRIRILREELKLTRKEFGAKIGVSGDVVNNWERERVRISDLSIKAICSAFSIQERWLRDGVGEMRSSSSTVFDDLLEELVKKYQLGFAGQAMLRAAARAFAELDEETATRIVNDAIAEMQAFLAAHNKVVADPSTRVVDPQSPADHDLPASSSGSVVD